MQEFSLKLSSKAQLDAKVNYVDSWRQIPSVVGAINNGEFQEDKQLKSILVYKNRSRSFLHDFKLGFVREQMAYNDKANDIFSNFLTNYYH